MTVAYKKKLIEVALPLEAINKESLHRKQKAPKGFPTSFHKWWAQRPLAACRAVIFASLVDDPSSRPDKFPTEAAQAAERERLLRFMEDLITWDNSRDAAIMAAAWKYILDSTDGKPPPVYDPFCGSGSIPLEAQRLGLESHASDLNPVAVIINKAMIEIPPKFAGKPPVNPEVRKDKCLFKRTWHGSEGLAADVRYYGMWMRKEAEKQIGHLYPKVSVTSELAKGRSDLVPLVGKQLTVIAWLWARTVRSPNPAFAHVNVPLVSNFVLSSKAGKEVIVVPVIENGQYRFSVRIGSAKEADGVKSGTSAGKRQAFFCLMSRVPIGYDYIRKEAKEGRMGMRLMAVVAEGDRGRVYLPPTPEMEETARQASPEWKPDCEMPKKHRDFKPPVYGMDNLGDIFTPRQLVALTTFSDLVQRSREIVKRDALAAGLSDDGISLADGGFGGSAYADAISVYLACVLDRMVYYGTSLTTWLPKDNALRDCMPRQVLAMTWDFAEGNPLGKSSGDVITSANSVANYLEVATPRRDAVVLQCDARVIGTTDGGFLFSTDPPYYDNINYAELSDFFYVWLRRSLKPVFHSLFATLTVPKAEELVATAHRHGSKEKAEAFFLGGMTQAMHGLAEKAHPGFPITIYYAFKQTEIDEDDGTASTGWETFLDAVIHAGLAITGTWPLRTEGAGRMIAKGTNALASSIVLVCRKRIAEAPSSTRRDFVTALKRELPIAVAHLQRGNIAPVDLAQAAIGPGMAVYTRYAKVLDARGSPLSVRDALSLINQTLDEALAEQEGDFDADTRWAVAWFEQSGFSEGEFGVAETLSKAKNTSVSGMVEAGILASSRGKVRILKPNELPSDWDPATDARLTSWEVVHQLVRVLESGGESAAAELVAKLGAQAEPARELCYRLFTLCERKKRAAEALSYNALVQSWPEITRLAREGGKSKPKQVDLFDQE